MSLSKSLFEFLNTPTKKTNNEPYIENDERKNTGLSQNQFLKEKEQKKNGQEVLQQKKNMDEYLQKEGDNLWEFNQFFLEWMREEQINIVFSSYKTGKVFTLSPFGKTTSDKNISMYMTSFNRPMGVHVDKQTSYIGCSGNLWRYENYGKGKHQEHDFDTMYYPKQTYIGSDIDIHDICVDKQGNPYYCSALFNCVCVPSVTHTFKVFWKPPWIDKIVPEDRCHLNGICSRDGVPRYVSCTSQNNVKGAWRDKREETGIIYDIIEDKIVCNGLTMPHSPRWYNNILWVLEAGTGYLCHIDIVTGEIHRDVFIPGFVRGLAFVNERYALVGSSVIRDEAIFQKLPLGTRLKKEGCHSKCGIYVIDLFNMNNPHTINFNKPITELYDVAVMDKTMKGMIMNFGEDKGLREYRIQEGDKTVKT